MRLIGFDPGLSVTGYACVDCGAGVAGAAVAGRRPTLVEAGHFSLGDADRERGYGPRLVELARDLDEMLERLAPERGAVEALFAHRAHPGAALAMAHARGVILERLARRSILVLELAPASVKKALTGSGRASKDQVAAAVVQALRLPAAPDKRDVTDAMAIAIAGAARAESTA